MATSVWESFGWWMGMRIPMVCVTSAACLLHCGWKEEAAPTTARAFATPTSGGPRRTIRTIATTTPQERMQWIALLWLTMSLPSSSLSLSQSTASTTSTILADASFVNASHVSLLFAHTLFLASLAYTVTAHYFITQLSTQQQHGNQDDDDGHGSLTRIGGRLARTNNLGQVSDAKAKPFDTHSRQSQRAWMVGTILLGPLDLAVPSCFVGMLVQELLLACLLIWTGSSSPSATHAGAWWILVSTTTSVLVACTTFTYLAWNETTTRGWNNWGFHSHQNPAEDASSPVIHSSHTRQCTNLVYSVWQHTPSSSSRGDEIGPNATAQQVRGVGGSTRRSWWAWLGLRGSSSSYSSSIHNGTLRDSYSSYNESHELEPLRQEENDAIARDAMGNFYPSSTSDGAVVWWQDPVFLSRWKQWSPAESLDWFYQMACMEKQKHMADQLVSYLGPEEVTCWQLNRASAAEIRQATCLPYGQVLQVQEWIHQHLEQRYPSTSYEGSTSHKDDNGVATTPAAATSTTTPALTPMDVSSFPEPHGISAGSNFVDTATEHPLATAAGSTRTSPGQSPDAFGSHHRSYYNQINQRMNDRFGMELPTNTNSLDNGQSSIVTSTMQQTGPQSHVPGMMHTSATPSWQQSKGRQQEPHYVRIQHRGTEAKSPSPATSVPETSSMWSLPPDFVANMPPHIAQIVQQKPHLVQQILSSSARGSSVVPVVHEEQQPMVEEKTQSEVQPQSLSQNLGKLDNDKNNNEENDTMSDGETTELLRHRRPTRPPPPPSSFGNATGSTAYSYKSTESGDQSSSALFSSF